eukprot:6690331-Pyramimonas_sp.AAC.1
MRKTRAVAGSNPQGEAFRHSNPQCRWTPATVRAPQCRPAAKRPTGASRRRRRGSARGGGSAEQPVRR